MKKKRVLFISSTGGHFNELQQLQPLFEKYDYHIITEKDKSTEKLTEKYANRNRKTATGRLVYPIADLFIVQWEELLKIYPKAVYGGAIY